MRDRLIELIREAKEHPEKTCPRYELPCIGCDHNKGDECDQASRLADYLLANGVIVPPCKVGDTLYGIRNLSKLPPIYSFTAPDLVWIIENADLFGKEIFLTKKEAEKALEGLK